MDLYPENKVELLADEKVGFSFYLGFGGFYVLASTGCQGDRMFGG